MSKARSAKVLLQSILGYSELAETIRNYQTKNDLKILYQDITYSYDDTVISASDIIQFWFQDIAPSCWWTKDESFDQMIRDRFSELHQKANACELPEWRHTSEGCLAEIIVLDQFSRNMYRDTPHAFASDNLALALAQSAIQSGKDVALTPEQRSFLYMPFMHSESLSIHEEAVRLYEKNGIQSNLEFEIKHKVIIERFGRYPHRNAILGRESTAEEVEFLKTNSGF